MEFVNRDFSAAISIRRHVVLKPTPEELKPSNVMGEAPRLEVCPDNLEPIAVGRSKRQGGVCKCIYMYPP
jgi:hypothetical protein